MVISPKKNERKPLFLIHSGRQQQRPNKQKNKKQIKELSSDIKTQREYERLADIDDENIQFLPPEPPSPQVYKPGEVEEQEEEQRGKATGKDYSPGSIFTSATLNKIERINTDHDWLIMLKIIFRIEIICQKTHMKGL